MTPDNSVVKPASTIALLAGIWLFVSPWVYGVYAVPNAWNSWIVGALIFIFAAIRLNRPGSSGLSWLNVILGVWTFASPWIYGYYRAESGRFINSLCVGIVVFAAALTSANALPRGTLPTQRTV